MPIGRMGFIENMAFVQDMAFYDNVASMQAQAVAPSCDNVLECHGGRRKGAGGGQGVRRGGDGTGAGVEPCGVVVSCSFCCGRVRGCVNRGVHLS